MMYIGHIVPKVELAMCKEIGRGKKNNEYNFPVRSLYIYSFTFMKWSLRDECEFCAQVETCSV